MTTAPEQVSWLHWLDTHAGAVQAILALVLTAITARYAWLTKKLLNQAETSTRAAERSAAANENTIAFMRQQYEEQLKLGPKILTQAIAETQRLLLYWRNEAVRQDFPHKGRPDPSQLERLPIDGAMNHALRLSPRCAQLLAMARSEVRAAKSEFDKHQKSQRNPYLILPAIDAAEPLDRAIKLLLDATKALAEDLGGAPIAERRPDAPQDATS